MAKQLSFERRTFSETDRTYQATRLASVISISVRLVLFLSSRSAMGEVPDSIQELHIFAAAQISPFDVI